LRPPSPERHLSCAQGAQPIDHAHQRGGVRFRMRPTHTVSELPRLVLRPPVESRVRVVAAVRPAEIDVVPQSEYVCVCARDTADAVRLLESSGPCLAIVDFDGPWIDAVKLCAVSIRVGTRVLATMRMPELAATALKAGCDSVLLKPFAPNLMAARRASRMRTADVLGSMVPAEGGCNVKARTPCRGCFRCRRFRRRGAAKCRRNTVTVASA
jgi:CheY-like chemotaxis protein